jgi:ribosomal protein S18 acetylase RimI-like enzyme
MDVRPEPRVSTVRKASSTMAGIPMTRDVRIRTAVPADADGISSLLHEAFAEFEPLYTPGGFVATTPDAMEIARRFAEGPVWVAVMDGRMVGTVAAVVKENGVYLRSMAVLSSTRGLGAGRLLLQTVEEFAIARQASRMFLSTTPFLAAAIRLYESAGFVRTGEPPDELLGTPLITMARSLV